MNAGAYGREMGDVVSRSVILEPDGSVSLLNSLAHGFSYRRSVFQTNKYIILEVEMRLNPSDKDSIKNKMEEYRKKRETSQPLDKPCAGSVFRRPELEGVFVGPMIEKCGRKGRRAGGAQVSEKHAGFIVNNGGATAADVLELIKQIRAAVKDRFNVELTAEIRVLGE
jgi:UDP-N-acetylmuramate dehydrogenase